MILFLSAFYHLRNAHLSQASEALEFWTELRVSATLLIVVATYPA